MGLTRSILNLGRWRGTKPNALVAGRVDARMGALQSGVLGVKSIQTGTSSLSAGANATVTITLSTAIVAARSFVVFHAAGNPNYQNSGPDTFFVMTLTANSISVVNQTSGTKTFRVRWQVVELY